MKTNPAEHIRSRPRSIGLVTAAGWALLTGLAIGWYGYTSAAHAETATTKPEPAKDESVINPPRPPSPAEILQELMKKDRVRPAPIPPSTPGHPYETQPAEPPTTGPGPKHEPSPLRPDGTMITDRIGRLTKGSKGWLFAFESEAKVLRESPMQILPNQDLETMERISSNGTVPVKFRVSGEVTTYRGANYLLLRKVLVVYGQGNLK